MAKREDLAFFFGRAGEREFAEQMLAELAAGERCDPRERLDLRRNEIDKPVYRSRIVTG